jgi:hypothetical protein
MVFKISWLLLNFEVVDRWEYTTRLDLSGTLSLEKITCVAFFSQALYNPISPTVSIWGTGVGDVAVAVGTSVSGRTEKQKCANQSGVYDWRPAPC